MDMLRRYWFWFGSGLALLVIVVLRLIMVGAVHSDYDTAVGKIERSAKQIGRKVKKSAALPNRAMIDHAKGTIAELEKVRVELNERLQERNAPLDSYFGFQVGTLRSDLPDPVSYKESYGNEIQAFADALDKYPDVETGLSIDNETNTLEPGAFEFDANLYRDGKISESDIPLTQKRFWIQKFIMDALLSVELNGVEIAPLDEIKEKGYAPVTMGKAQDGAEVNPKYSEGLYKKTYRIEKLTKLSVDNGLRYDKEKRFRLFKVQLNAEMQLSLVPKVLQALLAIEPMIVKIRDIQVVSSLGEKKSETKSELMNRYKEPSVEVEISFYGLDYLNEQERAHVASIQEDK